MTIKSNEAVAHEIGGLVAKQLNGVVSPSRCYSYDVETLTKLIEVKSCKTKTKGRKGLRQQYMQKGRFVIALNPHKKLVEEANKIGKDATYIFTLYQNSSPPRILDTKELSWNEVENCLSKGTRYTRRDGATLIIVDHTKIFRNRTRNNKKPLTSLKDSHHKKHKQQQEPKKK